MVPLGVGLRVFYHMIRRLFLTLSCNIPLVINFFIFKVLICLGLINKSPALIIRRSNVYSDVLDFGKSGSNRMAKLIFEPVTRIETSWDASTFIPLHEISNFYSFINGVLSLLTTFSMLTTYLNFS